jgi:hypothetical protein
MHPHPNLKAILKRGALVAASNWPVVVVQFVAESTFKLLLGVPLIGGALLVAALVGGDLAAIMTADLRVLVLGTIQVLLAHPAALVSFLLAFAIVLLGGSILMFMIKGGTVTVLVAGERAAGPIERPPLRLSAMRRAAQSTADRFVAGAWLLARRYTRLGLLLLGVYTISAGLYILVVIVGYQAADHVGFVMGWTVIATLSASVLVAWIMIINQVYLLLQMVMAIEDVSLRTAARRLGAFVRHGLRDVAAVFGIVALLAVAAAVIAILAAAGFGLIGFIPMIGLTVLPLQLAAWLVRGLVFQYLGLMALSAYIALYHRVPEPESQSAAPSFTRTA